jgi:hypothetical protein
MLALLRQLWTLLRRNPIALISVGMVVGVPIGWYLGAKSAVEKIPIPPAKAAAYATLSNEELKNKSAQLVSAIRGLTRSFYEEDNRIRITADQNSGSTNSQSERERIRKAWIDDSAKLHDVFMDRYKDNFWADAVLLREAIVARVGGAPGAQNPMLFQHPTNILGVEQVANSLELLGKSLPKRSF